MNFDNGMIKTITGQFLLIACCIFYLLWWSISYKPGTLVNRIGGINGILLSVTAVCGIAGTALSLYGINGLTFIKKPLLNGMTIIGGGVLLYFIMMFITLHFFDRPVTTELLLITGWAMLETAVINSLHASGILNNHKLFILSVVILTAYIISMILYIQYYRMEEWRAFYAAMVPLITEAISMAVLMVSVLIH